MHNASLAHFVEGQLAPTAAKQPPLGPGESLAKSEIKMLPSTLRDQLT